MGNNGERETKTYLKERNVYSDVGMAGNLKILKEARMTSSLY
jgi:hypothetical protein